MATPIQRALFGTANTIARVVAAPFSVLAEFRHSRHAESKDSPRTIKAQALVEAVCHDLRRKPPKVVVKDTADPGLAAFDVIGTRGTIVINAPVLDDLNSRQLRALIAHEMSHIRRGYSVIAGFHTMLLTATFGALGASGALANAYSALTASGFSFAVGVGVSALAAPLAVALVVAPYASVVAKIQRRQEFQADRDAGRFMRETGSLQTALEYLEQAGEGTNTDRPTFVFEPRPSRLESALTRFQGSLDSHPPLASRVEHLEQLSLPVDRDAPTQSRQERTVIPPRAPGIESHGPRELNDGLAGVNPHLDRLRSLGSPEL